MPNLTGAALASHNHFAMLFDCFVISLERQPEKLQAFGAECLIRGCFPMDNRPVTLRAGQTFPAYGIDCMMASVYPRMRAFACVSPLVMTPNDRKSSTTQRT